MWYIKVSWEYFIYYILEKQKLKSSSKNASGEEEYGDATHNVQEASCEQENFNGFSLNHHHKYKSSHP